jgi:hypothetical protein
MGPWALEDHTDVRTLPDRSLYAVLAAIESENSFYENELAAPRAFTMYTFPGKSRPLGTGPSQALRLPGPIAEKGLGSSDQRFWRLDVFRLI